MTIEKLKEMLVADGIDERAYSLDGMRRDEALILETKAEDTWIVYYSERGLRTGESYFGSESEACEYLLEKLLKDPLVKNAIKKSVNGSADSKWFFVGSAPDGKPFRYFGIDVWEHQWIDTKEKAEVTDPLYHQRFVFHVFEIRLDEKLVRFAAGEFSNCMWGFFEQRRD
jgi:hypothetical protein